MVVIGVLLSAVAAFFYARVIVLMFFNEPAPDGPSVVLPSIPTAVALGACVAITVALGVIPPFDLKLFGNRSFASPGEI